jgi:hypothetical protein
MSTRIAPRRADKPGPVHLHKLGTALLALVLAASVIGVAPAHAGRLSEAATRICTERGLKPDTPEFEKCYQEELIRLTGQAGSSIHGSP